ncbi:MAG: DNA methyltransferase [Limisphaerales bacterium]
MNQTALAAPEDRIAPSPSPREDNKLRLEDRAAHGWYRFVLSYPAHLVRTYLDRFGLKPGQTVLDPFCGTGTTLVECKKLGFSSCGIEPNPMASFASRTKLDWSVNPDELVAHASRVAELALRKFSDQGIGDEETVPLFGTRPALPVQLRTLAPAVLKLLLTDSISPLPLHKTLCSWKFSTKTKSPGCWRMNTSPWPNH